MRGTAPPCMQHGMWAAVSCPGSHGTVFHCQWTARSRTRAAGGACICWNAACCMLGYATSSSWRCRRRRQRPTCGSSSSGPKSTPRTTCVPDSSRGLAGPQMCAAGDASTLGSWWSWCVRHKLVSAAATSTEGLWRQTASRLCMAAAICPLPSSGHHHCIPARGCLCSRLKGLSDATVCTQACSRLCVTCRAGPGQVAAQHGPSGSSGLTVHLQQGARGHWWCINDSSRAHPLHTQSTGTWCCPVSSDRLAADMSR